MSHLAIRLHGARRHAGDRQRAETSSAARGVTIAFVASIGIVTGSGVVTLLFGVVARRRRAAIAAQIAMSAALISEARVTSTREETFRSLFDEIRRR